MTTWDHLSVTKPHLVYIILGGFTTLFMLCSTVIKERMYIGEATVATLCGVIFGPHAANLINPESWGSVDIVTIEFSRIVLVVQCFAVGVELPKFYMERHWRSVVFLLVPVMTFGWLITSLFVWWMVPPLNWLESLVVAACVTATDPVLASSVVGKGKFAKRVPKHLRDLLSAESGCNDGMAFPFVYLSLYLIQDHLKADKVTLHFIVYTIMYECIFGAVYGFLIGYAGRHGIKYAERHDLIDRESFLVFYFVLALFCAGSGSILGVDDLLVGFACGVGFSNDGWFTQQTEESHVSNVIDLLLNLTYFVYFGTIIPWAQFNFEEFGLTPWRLVVIAILVIFFRRIPIMMALKPLIPDIKTWREALFAGHFGPIGVGAIFIAILARAELESDDPVPLAELPPRDTENYTLIALVWPITAFLVVASILVHGSSIAVFTLGKRINTLTLTMSYTTAPEDGPSWMNRLPRISSQSRSQARTMSDTEIDEIKSPDFPPGTLPPVGFPGNFLRRVKDEDGGGGHSRTGSRASSRMGRRKKNKKQWDDGIGPGGPVSQSAIFPQRRSQSEQTSTTLQGENSSRSPLERMASDAAPATQSPRPSGEEEWGDREKDAAEDHNSIGESPHEEDPSRNDIEVYDEGDHIVVEDNEGEVLAVETPPSDDAAAHVETLKNSLKADAPATWTYDNIKQKINTWREDEIQKRKANTKDTRKAEPARAYQFGNTIIVEDEDGEVVKKYVLPAQKPDKEGGQFVSQSLKYMGMGGLAKVGEKSGDKPDAEATSPAEKEGETSSSKLPTRPPLAVSMPSWAGSLRRFTGGGGGEPSQRPQRPRQKSVVEEAEEDDDRNIRFKIGGLGQRMTKEDFIREMQKYDKRTRHQIVDQSTASNVVKDLAKADLVPSAPPKAGASRGKALAATPEETHEPRAPESGASDKNSSNASASSSKSSSPSPARRPVAPNRSTPSTAAPESAVERRRRLAVLKSVGEDEDDETTETPAERRRREAALGVPSVEATAEEDDDSDDDDTPRVPPTRRGIRFADVPDRGRS